MEFVCYLVQTGPAAKEEKTVGDLEGWANRWTEWKASERNFRKKKKINK